MLKILAVILCAVLVLTGCSFLEKEPENNWQSQSKAEESEPEVLEKEREFYPITGDYFWDGDKISFMSKGEILTLSNENEVVKRVSLAEVSGEIGGLYQNEKYILALLGGENEGAVTLDGSEIGFINATILDAEGKTIKNFPTGEIFYEEEGIGRFTEIGGRHLTCAEVSNLVWLTESKAVFSSGYNLILYDFENFAGEIIFEGHGEILESLNSYQIDPDAVGICGGKVIFNVNNCTAESWEGTPAPEDYTEGEWNVQTGAEYTWKEDWEVWSFDGEKVEKLFDGKCLAVADDFFVFNEGEEFFWAAPAGSNFYGKPSDGKATKLVSEEYPDIFGQIVKTNIFAKGSNILFRLKITEEERRLTFCHYDVTENRLYAYATEHTVPSSVIETVNGAGALHYLFTVDTSTAEELKTGYYLYNTQTGVSKLLFEGATNRNTPKATLSSSGRFIAEPRVIDGENHIRVIKIEW